eukprot:76177-Chlamydomonas_euryale.AAC.1
MGRSLNAPQKVVCAAGLKHPGVLWGPYPKLVAWLPGRCRSHQLSRYSPPLADAAMAAAVEALQVHPLTAAPRAPPWLWRPCRKCGHTGSGQWGGPFPFHTTLTHWSTHPFVQNCT